MALRKGPVLPLLLCLAGLLVWGAGRFHLASESRAESADRTVVAIDGDTVQLGPEVIDLYGIDAPELGQHCAHDDIWLSCGLTAAYELSKQLQLSRLAFKCYPAAGGDPGSRICFAGDVNVAEALLKAGYVIASPQANPDYRELEAKSRAARLGVWHSDFVDPSEWRQGERLPGEPGPDAEPCPVKAVTQDDGRRVYYVPTDEGYESIAIDPSRGDRLYCGDEDARRDGWRRMGEAAAP